MSALYRNIFSKKNINFETTDTVLDEDINTFFLEGFFSKMLIFNSFFGGFLFYH